jgi:endonuclease/exonuclease/phosphatase family metal-dependent hydrolase/predicted MPP superfamily phosphohydrolase
MNLKHCSILLSAIVWPCAIFAHEIAPKEENTIRIMSYNVHNCIGTDEQRDYRRIAGIISDIAPDVVAIQETDSATTRSNGDYVLKEVADRCLMFPLYAPAIDFQGGKYGIGILAKEKPLNVKHIPLPGREEARMLLIVEFEQYILACTHFSLTADDRLASVAIIKEAAKGAGKPFFLAGDMNATPGEAASIALAEDFDMLSDPKQNTSPATNPAECIDYIYAYKNSPTCSVLKRQVVRETVASDHLPLYVDVRLKTDAAHIFRTKPFLQNPTGNGITISWFTRVPTHSWIEYGNDKNLSHPRKAERIVDGQVICNTNHQKIRLTDLQPGATCYYRVCSREILLYQAYKKEFGDTAYSEVYSFTMPSPQSKDFKAIVFNDLHKNKQTLDELARLLNGLTYDFVFFNGDCIDDPYNETEAIDFLAYMADKVHAESTPFFYLRGNHEIRNAYSIRLRELLDYVDDKTYAAFNWGDTRFVMLDCGEDKPDSTWVYYNLNDFDGLRHTQIDFLRRELGGNAYKKASRRVLIHHIPTYGSDDAYNPCLTLWGNLLSKAPFDLCINGHTHKHAYHPKGSTGNNYPVFIGGGPRLESSTLMILEKTGPDLHLKTLNAKGEVLYQF